MAPEDTKITSWPRFLNAATSCAKLSNQARFRRPFSGSTSKVEPTFTTTRFASVNRWAVCLRSVTVMGTQYCHLLEQAASPNIRMPNQKQHFIQVNRG